MRRHIPGLHSNSRILKAISMDCFWSAWKELPIAGIGKSPF